MEKTKTTLRWHLAINILISLIFLAGLIVGLFTNIYFIFVISLFLLVLVNTFLGFVNQRRSLAFNLSLIVILLFSLSILTEYVFFIIGFLVSSIHLAFFIRYFLKNSENPVK